VSDPQLAAFAEKILGERGTDVRTKTSVTRVDPLSFQLSTGETVETHTVIWAAGVAPNPLISRLDLPKDERGRIRVNEFLEVEGSDHIWALGDCARVPDTRTGKTHPPTAQHAVREAKATARNISARYGVGEPVSFDYSTIGQMALVGERTGVADVMGHLFSGFTAWFIWRTYYLLQIPQLEKRVRVMLDWTLDLFFTRDLVQLAVTRERRLIPEKNLKFQI